VFERFRERQASMTAPAPVFIGGEIYRTSSHAPGHPLAIPRVSLCTDLCRALGWLPDSAYRESPRATPAELARYHDPEYIAAVMRAEREQAASEPVRRAFNLGINGNPVYAEMFGRPATACGASLLAARLLESPGVVYNPAGGTHHGQRGRASGFCTFNDPVLAILEMLDAGLERVFYLDLDAHFGDGVQQAFHDDGRVFTLSIHEDGRWPMARGDRPAAAPGGVRDRAGGAARNLPVPRDFNDCELAYLMETAVVPLIEAFAPRALVIQCGADALAEDPMTRLGLSNRALWRSIRAVKAMAPRLLVLGGGGYNPWSVARCWAGVWAELNEFPVPDRLPAAAETILRAVQWNHRHGRTPPERWFTTLVDPPQAESIRPEIRTLAAEVLR
jgi:acetoin utilization protein AcuC